VSTAATTRRVNPSEQVASLLRQQLASKRLNPHDRLPTVRALSRDHGVAVNTVRKALDILEREGLLYRREGNGTFVNPEASRPHSTALASGLKCVTIIHGPRAYLPGVYERDVRLLVGYTQAVEAANLRMRFAHWSGAGDAHCGHMLSAKYPPCEQGCILFDAFSSRLMSWLAEHDVPFVVQSNATYDRSNLPDHHSLIIDKTGAGYNATRYLIRQGHRQIGFIGSVLQGGIPNPLQEGRMAALRGCGLEDRPSHSMQTFSEDAVESIPAIRDYLSQPGRPTAILAGNDPIAATITDEAVRLGIRVPHDLSVFGYNNDPIAATAPIPITTYDQPREGAGSGAIELLCEVAHKRPTGFLSRILECRLVVRQTVGPWPPPDQRAAPASEGSS